MKAQRHQQIEELFHAALAQAPKERTAFLEQACGEDEGLRCEVESLLSFDDRAASFIETPPASMAAAALAAKQEHFMLGRQLGHYQILSRLGAGGMGEVYLAQDKKLDRKVAIKLLPPESVADEKAKKRFIREAQVAAKLDHPNICAIHEVGEANHQIFIVMQYVEGETLSSRIQGNPLSLGEALDVAVQVAQALVEAHSLRIIHRDIKPANLMITAQGQVKVLDFGLAKMVQETLATDSLIGTESLLSQPGIIIGTMPYMSPEQVRGEALEGRSDLFSFGVVLYEIVGRVQPFVAENVADMLSAILTYEPPPLARYARDVPPELERIVAKALRKERDERYQSAQDLLIDLKTLRDELTFEAKLQRRTSPGSARQTDGNTASGQTPATALQVQAQSQTLAEAKTAATAGYLLGKIKLARLKMAMIAGLVLAVLAVSYLYFFATGSKTAINSVAVLPFINASQDANAEYLSDGITESVINNLSQLGGLRVMSRNSAFRFKDNQTDNKTIASQLGVETLVTGDIKQIGDRFVINIRLIKASDDSQIWGNQYVKASADILAVQNEIARAVAQNLRLKLSSSEQQRLSKNYTANVEAYQLYLRGRFHIFKITPPEVQKGIAYLQQAIDMDPNYALAYAGLADAYRTLALGAEMLPTEVMPKSKAAADKAIAIDDTLSDSHTALGMTLFWLWDWRAAEKQFQRALLLNPNDVNAHLCYAHLLSNTGRHAEALAEVKLARELDPLFPLTNALEGLFLLHAGRIDEALDKLQKTFELAPNFWLPHAFASSAYIEKGMYAEGVAEARKAREFSPFQTASVSYEGYALAKAGRRDEARAVLNELLKLSTVRFVPPVHIAMIYNGLGERNKIFEWLERGYQQSDPKMAFLGVDPKWNNFRDDPRFQDLLRRMNFPL
jgi:serine/threonine protein kinase/TolB-like protein/Flp pilus assembly protein TadD